MWDDRFDELDRELFEASERRSNVEANDQLIMMFFYIVIGIAIAGAALKWVDAQLGWHLYDTAVAWIKSH